jgi:hypothetical protein
MTRGKGSDKHKNLQKVLSTLLREMGYLVIIEPAFDSRNADLLVQDIQSMKTTIIEIELHKNYRHALQSIRSDLQFCNEVIVLCENVVILRRLNDLCNKFCNTNRNRIHFVPINHYLNYIRTLFQNKNNRKNHNKSQNNIRHYKDKGG